ncbi:hypothetical protein GALL_443160 [mine drainage metagenome]|uniref:Uncharacterized protein n=1 Tax=mine drainage metagenome TaxID=410659 RepID=A0A1J5PT86_9ZZZZ
MSRAAVLASSVATPSRRLSSWARRDAVRAPSALTRSRSSRTSSATTWNFVRTAGRVGGRRTAPSTSRATSASTGMIPCSAGRGARRRWAPSSVRAPPDRRWPGRATSPPSQHPHRDCGAAHRAAAARDRSAAGPHARCRRQPWPGRSDRAPGHRAASPSAPPALTPPGVSVNHREARPCPADRRRTWSVPPDTSTESGRTVIAREFSGQAADGMASYRCTIIAAVRLRPGPTATATG